MRYAALTPVRHASAPLSAVLAMFVLLSLSMPLVLRPLCAQPAVSTQMADPRKVILRIETSRSSYRQNDSIALRIAFSNGGPTSIRFLPGAPWGISRLVITDSSGRVVLPVSGRSGFSAVSSRYTRLAPGKTEVRTWNGEWFDLRRWGYGALTPGRYAIVGAPVLVARDLAPDSTVRSNRVTFTVTP